MNADGSRVEVADIVRLHGDAFMRSHRLSLQQRRVLFRLAACRTARLGGHVDACPSCGFAQGISYNSCRDRHCPKCQGRERAQWIDRALARVLPTAHFHIVFTLPDTLSPLILRSPKLLYDLLFRASAQALMEIAADPRHLGADIGFTSVLHTWAQNLLHHPHVHCIVTAGGLSPDATHWIKSRPRYLLPVKVLGKRFKHLFMQSLILARQQGELALTGNLATLQDPTLWASFRNSLYQKSWVIFSKRAFHGPSQLFRYLGNYTHRVGISNHRLVALDHDAVTFTIRDRDASTRKRRLTLHTQEFIRRFLLHILPKGFVRIRHYGLYAGSNLTTKLIPSRLLLEPKPQTPPRNLPPNTDLPEPPNPWWRVLLASLQPHQAPCPECGTHMVRQWIQGRTHSSTRASPVAA